LKVALGARLATLDPTTVWAESLKEPPALALTESPEARAESARRGFAGCPASIAVFAGELSGDLQGAALVQEMMMLGARCSVLGSDNDAGQPPGTAASSHSCRAPSTEHRELHFWGIGGKNMRLAGVELTHDSSCWGAMGLIEALKLAPRLLWVLRQVRGALARRRPALVILIDFGAFNVRVAAAAKQLGLPVFYYFPPGSWRRDPGAAGQLPQLTDRVATPFPWSAEILRAAGADAHYVGHPMVDLAKSRQDRAAFCAALGLDPDWPIVCYLPGSRRHEIRDIWPPMAGAARLLTQRDPRIQHVVVQAPGVEIPRSGLMLHVTPAAAVHDALAAADLAVTKAGSVTLEVALHQRPMVVIYRGSWLQELEYRLWHRRRIRFIAMPNILADESVCPELIQREASPERIAALAWELLTDTSKREAQTRKLAEVASMLGPPGAVRRAAQLALEML
jgi:lipid-A-disaccharide synthase